MNTYSHHPLFLIKKISTKVVFRQNLSSRGKQVIRLFLLHFAAELSSSSNNPFIWLVAINDKTKF